MSAVSVSRALLAHYNRQVASRLVRHVLKESSPAARVKVADTILGMIPEALKDRLWQELVSRVEPIVVAYTSSQAFQDKLQKRVATQGDSWIDSAVEQHVKIKAQQAVDQHLRSYQGGQSTKMIPVMYQAQVQAEIAKRAAEEVARSK